MTEAGGTCGAPVSDPAGEVSERLVLAGEFPTPHREQWLRSVEAVLGAESGTDVEERLSTRTYDGITVKPLYVAGDAAVAGFPGLAPFVRGGRPEGSVSHGWEVRQHHGHSDPAAVNDEILADLENGVASVWLTVGDGGLAAAELGTALNRVRLDLAGVVLDAGAGFRAAAESYLELVRAQGIEPDAAVGNLGIDPLGVLARTGRAADMDDAMALAARCARTHRALRTITVDALPYHDAGGSDAEELGCSIAAGTAYLRALTAAGIDVDMACRLLEFRYAVTADQFLGIAKLRAARRLWDRVTEAAGAAPAHRAQRQHAVTSAAMLTRRDPWVNMLRGTVACFAAGVGGADAVTVRSFDAAIGRPDAFGRRIARNTQALLVEESHVAKVIDPAGGSWCVESLTTELAKAGWAWFQQIERAGGLAEALNGDLVAERLADTWRRRSAAIAHRRDAITGVSEFPDIDERPVERQPLPVRRGGGLPVVRYAEAYERLRDDSDAMHTATGQRPTLFLATLGPTSVHTGRSTFAANLFNAGGVRTLSAGASSSTDEVVAGFTSSGTDMVCVCSSDDVYAERAADTVAALRAAGARRVLLAGSPRRWAASGADDFVFAGCDAVRVLTDIHRGWGAT
ncbi:MAG: methylmalonyl-CoA mutase subunit beta [Kutzneria sp.]|nr:methylmalonyl-CoA mutase subunit beta [Kutzneria sp.]MBV9843577.1 methylmalonyl-CoA mutase subunit beta [Kutzneria sp.]